MSQDKPLFSRQLCKGNGDYKKMFNIQSFNDELRVDIRQWVDNKPTIKGVSMPFIRWQHLVELIPDIDGYVEDLQAGEDPKARLHVGAKTFVTLAKPYHHVNIRNYYVNLHDEYESLMPTRKGLTLKFHEWSVLKSLVPLVYEQFPEIASMVSCSASSNHLNQEGFADCFECNPRFHRDRELKRLEADGVDEPDSGKNGWLPPPSTGTLGGRPGYYKQVKRSKTV